MYWFSSYRILFIKMVCKLLSPAEERRKVFNVAENTDRSVSSDSPSGLSKAYDQKPENDSMQDSFETPRFHDLACRMSRPDRYQKWLNSDQWQRSWTKSACFSSAVPALSRNTPHKSTHCLMISAIYGRCMSTKTTCPCSRCNGCGYMGAGVSAPTPVMNGM